MQFQLIIKVVFLFFSRWLELDKAKREKKKELNKEIVDAVKIKDKKERASRLNSVVDKSNRL